MPTIQQASRPMPDPLSKAFFAADFERVEKAHRTVQLNDLPPQTQQAVREFIDGGSTTASADDQDVTSAYCRGDVVGRGLDVSTEKRRVAAGDDAFELGPRRPPYRHARPLSVTSAAEPMRRAIT